MSSGSPVTPSSDPVNIPPSHSVFGPEPAYSSLSRTPPSSRRSDSSSPPSDLGLLTSAHRVHSGESVPGGSGGSIFLPMASSTPSLLAIHSTASIPNPTTLHSILAGTLSARSSGESKRKPSLHVALPKFGSQVHNGSSDSLNKSPHSPDYGMLFTRRKSSPGSILGEDPIDEKPVVGPTQGGLTGEHTTTQFFIQQFRNTLGSIHKERSYKVQRKNYRKEKQRVAQELNTALKDPTIVIMSGTLKVRGKLKGWTKLWAVLKPGLLIFYKSSKVKSSTWVATVLLYCCKLIQRPSKKDGFCFKVFHPLEQSIWSTKGPDGETMGAVVQPLPQTYLICRAASVDDGKCWMDGLELALTCSSLLVRSPRGGAGDSMEDKSSNETEPDQGWCCSDDEEKNRTPSDKSDTDTSHVEEQAEDDFRETDEENEHEGGRHPFNDNGPVYRNLCKDQGSHRSGSHHGDSRSSFSTRHGSKRSSGTEVALLPPKQSNYIPSSEDFSTAKGEHVEELADENKSLLWFLIKQVRPGMDLSRVVLPTFILEPRSFLDKLSDYYYHADYLSLAVLEDDPFTRLKYVLRWYLSGFYKKPKGLKKPYNPVLGETFRCMWKHPNGTNTFYIAEQVSHHPPVSAFYVSNKKDGYVISSAILTKSKFYGNSTSAILEGQATLTLLPRGEVYLITMPFAHCKGILMGTLTMELGGTVTIACDKTGYHSEMEFKLKSFLSRADNINAISGKIKLGRETLATVEGHWDNKITFKDKRTSAEETLWEVTDHIKGSRLKRFTVPLDEQLGTESEKLWIKVSEAILKEDQEAATVEKTVLEERQRRDTKDRQAHKVEWHPKFFIHDGNTWRYKFEDNRPWDDGNDILEYELDYVIATHRKHETPVLRTSSLLSVECDMLRDSPSDKVVPAFHQRESNRQLLELLRQLLAHQIQQSEEIKELKGAVASIQARLARPKPPKDPFPITNTILAVIFAVGLQLLLVIYWFGDGKLIPEIKRPGTF